MKFISSYKKDKTNNKNVHILLDNENCTIELVKLLDRIINTYSDDENENIRKQYSLIGVRKNKNDIVKNDMYMLYLIKKQNSVDDDDDEDEDKFMFQYPYKKNWNIKDGSIISINDKKILGLNEAISEMKDLINQNKNDFSISKTYFDKKMKELYFNSLTNHSNV